MSTSHGSQIDALLKEYLHGDEMRSRVADAARAADIAVKAELAPHIRTGHLFESSDVEVREFAAGYGIRISSLYLSYMNFNRKGIRRLREPGYRRGAGIRRKRGFKAHSPFLDVSSPSILGDAVKAFNDETGVWL